MTENVGPCAYWVSAKFAAGNSVKKTKLKNYYSLWANVYLCNEIYFFLGTTIRKPRDDGFPRTAEMMATLQQNNKNLLAITADFKSVSSKIDSGNGLISALINDPSMASRLRISMNDLQAAVANFKTASVTGNTVFNNLQVFSGKLDQPHNSINKFVSETAMYASIVGDLQQLPNAAKSVSAFAANLEKTSEKPDGDKSAAGVLLNDPASAISVKRRSLPLKLQARSLMTIWKLYTIIFCCAISLRKKQRLKRKQSRTAFPQVIKEFKSRQVLEEGMIFHPI